jgi:hypothetical protein
MDPLLHFDHCYACQVFLASLVRVYLREFDSNFACNCFSPYLTSANVHQIGCWGLLGLMRPVQAHF